MSMHSYLIRVPTWVLAHPPSWPSFLRAAENTTQKPGETRRPSDVLREFLTGEWLQEAR